MNILLTSVGRRNYMVEYFKKALEPYKGKVFAMNSDTDAPGLWVADEYIQAPLIYDDGYSDFLLSYCKSNNIKLVISLFDIELPVLSKLKYKFRQHGIAIIVGDEWLTKTSNDKWETHEFLKKHGFSIVQTFLSFDEFRDATERLKIRFPVFVKPRWGMGSISIYSANTVDEAEFYYQKVKHEIQKSYLMYESRADSENAVIIQERLPGNEYGLDVINNLEGNHYATIVKRKLAMRAGETDAAVTVEEPILRDLGTKLANLTRHPANMDVDVFFDGETPYILELNPRFGGGYPFSHAAGVDLPKAIIEWHYKKEVDITKLLTPQIGVKTMKGIIMISKRDE